MYIVKESSENEKIEINEKIFVEDICKIIDIDFIPLLTNRSESNGIINYEGYVKIKILYEIENKQGLCEKQVKIPFIIKRNDSEEIDLIISRKDFALSNENVNISLEIQIKKVRENNECINIIKDIKIEDIKEENDYSVIIYFIKPGDTLWEICKRFKVSRDGISKYNDLEDSKIIPGNKLYIVR